eukprot:CAMPEP_0172321644 /NCGR_PEP_ID=MMETSP1058-20130122/43929_1 /TAXON_ID=83371 /ORGANISM="Detonula confervacea, Strain CCMP 353" /LENGTH=773 /DNA_ID=CAMNT_0013037211 /DNA_START=86 /DNA_END=2407 /DNA_ORIENTATION=-
MATLTAAAARRALYCRRALLRPHSGAATIIDGSTDAETRIAGPILWNQCSSTWPTTISGHQDSMTCRSFSSVSTDSVISPTEAPSSNVSGSGTDSDYYLDDHNPASRTPRRRRKSKKSNSTTEETSLALTPLTEDEYDPEKIVSQCFKAAEWNQGVGFLRNKKYNDRNWDYDFVRLTVDDYERHLQYVLDHLKSRGESDKGSNNQQQKESSDALLSNIHPSPEKCAATHKLLSPKTLANSVRSLTRSKMDTPLLSQRIRDIERLVGLIGWTPITEELSYRLLEANGKAGNVRRTLALLELRRRRGYEPREQDERNFSNKKDNQTSTNAIERGEKEFIHALTSIQSAQLPLRRSRNIYLHESSLSESALDNPTRYLDAILLNMSQRGVPLRPEMASQMLSCYASTGRTGRALHYFYKVVRDPVEDDGFYIPGPHPTHLSKLELEEWKEARRQEGMGRHVVSGFEKEDGVDDSTTMETLDDEKPLPSEINSKVRMIMHPPPPFHKIPSHVKGARLAQSSDLDHNTSTFVGAPRNSMESSFSESKDPQYRKAQTKYEWEVDREWSLTLTAAFAFADSLTHGACGHEPIELDVGGWNCLIKACCYRGAFHRALKILNETMPQKGIEPDSFSYNTILAGLARVGDIPSLKEYLISMTNKRILIDKYTVQAMADGFLNVGDISGASTMVQDCFNQHDTLPPYTTHLKIIEFALSTGLIFEAKRHVYFVQQLWKWQPSTHHDKKFCKMMEATKHNPKLSKPALKELFAYFREDLQDEDFF